MAPVTFVCDLCGTSGRAEAPGAAQCLTCGQVALVGSRPRATRPPEPDPFAAAAAVRGNEPGTPDGVDFVLDDEVIPPPPGRLASLWVPPGRDDGSTPEPSIPDFARVRGGRRALAAVGALAASGVLALGIAIGAGLVDLGPDAGDGSAAPPEEARTGTGAGLAAPAPAPGLEPARPPRRSQPEAALPEAKPARAVAPRPVPAPEGEPLRDLQLAAHRNPAPVDRQCVPRALRARPDVAARLPEEIRARFPVAASGAVGPVEVMGDVPDPEVAGAIEEAIRGCPFVPGADEEGRPIPLSVVMRIRFAVQ